MCIRDRRKLFAKTQQAKQLGLKAGDFSYNTGKLRCPVCDGTGVISLDVQFLPDVEVPCPDCRGSRYSKEADRIQYQNSVGNVYSLPELMAMDIDTALHACCDLKLSLIHISLRYGPFPKGFCIPSISVSGTR